jgi:tRNA modification GTPase
LDRDGTVSRLRALISSIGGLAATFRSGRLLREGASVVLAGKPNAGKSSLFNALLRESRAIVTAHPGTTRDLLEETIVLDGIPLRLHDTAGIREAREPAEEEGVRRSLSAVEGADVLVVVIDPHDLPEESDIQTVRSRTREGQKLIWAINKCDTLGDELSVSLEWVAKEEKVVLVSALTGVGLNELEGHLVAVISSGEVRTEEVTITSERHFAALQRSIGSLSRAVGSIQEGYSNEFVSLDVREAANQLAEITGEITNEEILNSIFHRFCVGK